ncbi:hypothetical protein BASA81_007948 [Batrachochytrium salamandrivorans]|nr:hypothetical protein BASA81_007948 [Batrachochytrium salamandrivorans]
MNSATVSDNPIASMEALRARGIQEHDLEHQFDKAALPTPSSNTAFSNLITKPTSAVKRVCCGTRRRKTCCGLTVLIIAILVFYLIGMMVETLKIMDTEPSMKSFTMGSLCGQSQRASLAMEVANPSSTATTLLPMKCALSYKVGQSTETTVIGYASIPQVYVPGGVSTLNIDFDLDFPMDRAAAVRELIQRYLGTDDNVTLVIELPLTASFSSDVFLVPLSISTAFLFEFPLPSFSDDAEGNETSSSSYLQTVELLTAKNATKYVKAAVGLQLWNVTEPAKFSFELPELGFAVLVNGLTTATGRSSKITYGKPEVDQVVHVTAALGEENLMGVHYVLNSIFNSAVNVDMPISLVVLGEDSDHEEYAQPSSSTCYLTQLIQGLRIDMNMSSNFSSNEEDSGAEDSSYFNLEKLQLVDVTVSQGLVGGITIDLQGLVTQFYNVHGIFPALEVQIDVDVTLNSSNAQVQQLATLQVPLGFAYNATVPVLNDLAFNVLLNNATLALQVADLVLLSDFPVVVKVYIAGSSLIARLLAPVSLEFNLWELLKGPTSSNETNISTLRRRLASGDKDSYGINLDLFSDEASILGDLQLKGFDTDFFGGLNVIFHPFTFDLQVDNYAGGWENMPIVSIHSTTGFDSNDANSELQLGLVVGDEYAGQLLWNVVNNLTDTNSQSRFNASLTYGNSPTITGAVLFQRSHVPDSSKQNTSSVSANEAASLFELFHAELMSLYNNEVAAMVYFGIDLGNVALNVSVPSIAVAVDHCDASQDYFLGVFLDAWNFTAANKNAGANLRAGLKSTKALMDLVNTWNEGHAQDFCLRKHPTWGNNFLSNMVGTLVGKIELAGKDTNVSATESPTVPTTDTTASSLITSVQIDSDNATHACVTTLLHLYKQSSELDLGFSLGWGDAHILVESEHEKLFDVSLQNGWFGPIDAHRIAHYKAPAVGSSTQVSLCLGANAEFVKKTIQTVLNGTSAVNFNASGTWVERLSSDASVTQMDLDAQLPANTLDFISGLLSTTGGEDDEEAPSMFEFERVSIQQLNNAEVSVHLGVTLAADLLGFSLRTPEIRLRVGKLNVSNHLDTEVQWFDVATHLPEFGNESSSFSLFPIPLNATLIGPTADWAKVIDIAQDFMGGNYSIVIGSSTAGGANLISRIIPTLTVIKGNNELREVGTLAPTFLTTLPPTSPDDFLDVAAAVISAANSASVLVNVTVLDQLSFAISWEDIHLTLSSPGWGEVGSIYIPKQLPLQAVNSGPQLINITLFGAAPKFLQQFLMNSSFPTVMSIDGTIGSAGNKLTAWLTIPGFSDNLVSDDSITSLIQLTDLSVLGASNVGVSGTLPCFFESMCVKNVIRNDSQLAYGGVTAGVTFSFDQLPEMARIRWKLSLLSDAVINLDANGYNLGKVAVRPPLHVSSAQTSFSPIVSFIPNHAYMAEMRATITSVMDGYDTVFSLSGAQNENFLSKALDAIAQDFAILDVPEPDPDAPSMLQTMSMTVGATSRTSVILEVGQAIRYDSLTYPVINVGTVHAEVLYGHTKTCGGEWCLNGVAVIRADTYGALQIAPQPEEQTIKIRGEGFHSGGVLSQSQQIFDNLMSAYVWNTEMALEAYVDVTPTQASLAKYGITGNATFRFVTYLTIPATSADSGFIDSITVSYGDTLASIAKGDLKINAVKVLKNTMTFPILVSYFQYTIKLIDTDGVDSQMCTVGTKGMFTAVNPCSFGYCYAPYTVPTAVAPLITSSAYASLKPGNSLLSGMTLLPPGQTGSTSLVIDVNVETAARLMDEMMIKTVMCGDLEDGIVVVGLQGDSSCNDKDKLESALTCTFPMRIKFNLKNYVLGGTDTCGAKMEVPAYLPTTFYSEGFYQFPSLAKGPNVETMLITNDWDLARTISDLTPINLLDSFQIYFEFQATSHCKGGAGEAIALHFMVDKPNNVASPVVQMDCSAWDGSCEARYASNRLQVANSFSSLVLAYYQCNSIAWVVKGNFGSPYRASQSCAAKLDGGDWGGVTFTYNAHDKRAQVTYFERKFDFDLNLPAQLDGKTMAYLALGANTSGWTCSRIDFRNFVRSGPRTNGLKTTLETRKMQLPAAGQRGFVVFRARDENGRKRGVGGNTWTYTIVDSVTGAPANHNTGLTPRFEDNQDGTYKLFYQINTRGRYRITVACVSGAAPNVCNSPNVHTVITDGLFIRLE